MRRLRNETEHAVVATINGVYKIILYFFRNKFARQLMIKDFYVEFLFNETVFSLKRLAPFGNAFLLEGLHVLLRQSQYDLSLIRDSVAHIAAIPSSQACCIISNRVLHEARHQLISISAAQVNLQT